MRAACHREDPWFSYVPRPLEARALLDESLCELLFDQAIDVYLEILRRRLSLDGIAVLVFDAHAYGVVEAGDTPLSPVRVSERPPRQRRQLPRSVRRPALSPWEGSDGKPRSDVPIPTACDAFGAERFQDHLGDDTRSVLVAVACAVVAHTASPGDVHRQRRHGVVSRSTADQEKPL